MLVRSARYLCTESGCTDVIRRFPAAQDSRPIMEAARAAIAKEKGDAALEPWSLSYSIAGDTEKALDPYFAFENAVDVWARTFAGLGIKCSPPPPPPRGRILTATWLHGTNVFAQCAQGADVHTAYQI